MVEVPNLIEYASSHFTFPTDFMNPDPTFNPLSTVVFFRKPIALPPANVSPFAIGDHLEPLVEDIIVVAAASAVIFLVVSRRR